MSASYVGNIGSAQTLLKVATEEAGGTEGREAEARMELLLAAAKETMWSGGLDEAEAAAAS